MYRTLFSQPMAPRPKIDPSQLPVAERPAPATGCLLGLISSVIAGFLGIPGVSWLTQALIQARQFEPESARTTAVATMAPALLAGAVTYHLRLAPDSEIGLGDSALAAVGAILGAALAAQLAAPGAARRPLHRVALGVGLLSAAALGYLAFTGRAAPAFLPSGWPGLMMAAGAGGALSALAGGGGLLVVPALVLLLGMEQHRAQGMALAIAGLGSALAGLLHFTRGNVAANLSTSLMIGGIAGAVAASLLALALPAGLLRGFFALALAAGCILVWRLHPAVRDEPETGTSAETPGG